jgi:hypothetical protein
VPSVGCPFLPKSVKSLFYPPEKKKPESRLSGSFMYGILDSNESLDSGLRLEPDAIF